VKLVKERIPARFGFDPKADIQVLSPMNRSLLGARNLNQVLQQALNPGDGGPEVQRFGWTYRIGDRAIQTENDYNRDVFNGDLGVVEKINRIEQTMTVMFEGQSCCCSSCRSSGNGFERVRRRRAMGFHRGDDLTDNDTCSEGPITVNLPTDEGKLFYDLYAALLSFVNRKLEVSPETFSDSREYTSTPPEARVAIRDALFEHRELIDEFVGENRANLKADELEIVATWKHALPGMFYVFRYLKKYTIFLTSDGSLKKAYGVLGLADPMDEVIGPYLPRLITTVLLPFKGKIIYDGLVSGYNVTFGGGTKRRLNEEYADLCRKLAAALARKRPSPLLRGRLETWAAGVVRTIGWVNFLHDPSQTPHLKLYSIDEAFGMAESTGAAKLKEIRTMFRIRQFDPKWTLPSQMDDNPMVWMLEVNGFLMDIRHAPRELQEVAFEKGLIPYIPADRAEADEGS
jgi:hypothetical protein